MEHNPIFSKPLETDSNAMLLAVSLLVGKAIVDDALRQRVEADPDEFIRKAGLTDVMPEAFLHAFHSMIKNSQAIHEQSSRGAVQAGQLRQNMPFPARPQHYVAQPPAPIAPGSAFSAASALASPLVTNINVHIQTLGQSWPDGLVNAIARTLHAVGFSLDPHRSPALLLVLAEHYQDAGLAQINEHALGQGLPWVLVNPGSLHPVLGPIFIPGKTACWQCMQTHLQAHPALAARLQQPTPPNEAPTLLRMRQGLGPGWFNHLLLLQLMKWLATGSNPELESGLVLIDMFALHQSSQPVPRYAACSACGSHADVEVEVEVEVEVDAAAATPAV